MAVLPIQITGNPVLHARASDVTSFDDDLATLIADMFDTMEAAPGVGLAAPQVDVPLRLFVFNWTDDDATLWRGVAINPVLWVSPVPIGPADDEAESEGCLSVPGERFALRRSELAVLSAVDLDQRPFEIRAEGWLARIFQHEYDHLDGVLYVDRLNHAEGKSAIKTLKKNGWGEPGLSWIPGVDDLEG
ncbi:MAG: peptide deformylase [Microbacteriaceae bacterium]|nr:peptide deformylase [Microbacteriaceae bacterium]